MAQKKYNFKYKYNNSFSKYRKIHFKLFYLYFVTKSFGIRFASDFIRNFCQTSETSDSRDIRQRSKIFRSDIKSSTLAILDTVSDKSALSRDEIIYYFDVSVDFLFSLKLMLIWSHQAAIIAVTSSKDAKSLDHATTIEIDSKFVNDERGYAWQKCYCTSKNAEKFSKHNAKNSTWKFLTVPRNRQNWNYFTQLLRQWLCLLKAKIHLTLHGINQYQC